MIGTKAAMRFGRVAALVVAFGGVAAAQGKDGGKRAPAPAPEAAAEQASCQILEIRASNEPGGIDAALEPLAKKLKRPPFSAWTRFALLKQHERSAARGKAVDLALVPGGKLSVLYRERAAGARPRLRLSFTLDDKAGKRLFNGTVNLEAGDHSLIGGERLDGDATYILAVTCRA